MLSPANRRYTHFARKFLRRALCLLALVVLMSEYSEQKMSRNTLAVREGLRGQETFECVNRTPGFQANAQNSRCNRTRGPEASWAFLQGHLHLPG